MGFGLFGKLPQKRDFVALGLSRSVLEPFEAWMQAGVAASRMELGERWQDFFLVAPVWRFWIGSAVLGTSTAGAFIPSVDGVGRFFPLALMFCAESGEVAPPPFAPQEEWYAALAGRLLGVLDENAAVDAEALPAGLEAPQMAGSGPDPAPLEAGRGLLWRGEGPAEALLRAAASADYWRQLPARSFWWTQSPAGSLVYTRGGLPDPHFFATMLQGETA